MFICRYVGEVITEAEAERRGEEYDRKVYRMSHISKLNYRELHIFLISTFSMFTRITHQISDLQSRPRETYSASMLRITVMYLGSSTIRVIPMSPYTRLSEMVITVFTILPYSPSKPSNPMKNCVLIIKQKMVSKPGNNVIAERGIVGGGYSEVDRTKHSRYVFLAMVM